jgi:hypothetical protein
VRSEAGEGETEGIAVGSGCQGARTVNKTVLHLKPPSGDSLRVRPNGLELSCPAEAGKLPLIVAPAGGPGALAYAPARRVSFSELLGGQDLMAKAWAWRVEPPREWLVRRTSRPEPGTCVSAS